jgi:hypothetical protein
LLSVIFVVVRVGLPALGLEQQGGETEPEGRRAGVAADVVAA